MAADPDIADTKIADTKIALPVAAATVFLAGATDVCGFIRLKEIFVSFMSGNTTMLGIALGHADWPRAGLIAGIVTLFVLGAAIGAALAQRAGRHQAGVVMAVVTLLLTVPLLRDAWTVPALLIAMGMLNETMSHVGATGIGLTFVTGGLVKFAGGLGRRLAGHKGDGSWLVHAWLWLSLLAGAVAATLLQGALGTGTIWPLPLLAALLVPLHILAAAD